jgi:dihydrofolate reductase
MRITLVAAVARDGAVGRAGGMPWHLPADLAHFKRSTLGRPVVMGRKTWDSLPPRFRPLPGRRNVVVTRNRGWSAEGAEPAPSLAAALQLLAGSDEVCVIGGGELYAQALPLADRLLLTELDTEVPDADTHFPAWDRSAFVVTDSVTGPEDAPFAYRWTDYERRR